MSGSVQGNGMLNEVCSLSTRAKTSFLVYVKWKEIVMRGNLLDLVGRRNLALKMSNKTSFCASVPLWKLSYFVFNGVLRL